MVAYYKDEAAVDAALKKAKTQQEVRKIAQDLEQRMAHQTGFGKPIRRFMPWNEFAGRMFYENR